MLGIGASSSAAYTLRKHYSKFILGFECQYDRGGADPTQVMQQAEAGTKKKSTKNISVPSPGRFLAHSCVMKYNDTFKFYSSGWFIKLARFISDTRCNNRNHRWLQQLSSSWWIPGECEQRVQCRAKYTKTTIPDELSESTSRYV